MTAPLTDDAKVILLLCGQFSRAAHETPLALHEYNALVRWLVGAGKRPSALLDDRCALAEAAAHAALDAPRLERLLARGVQLGFAVEEWQHNGLWVISRSDADYPARYRQLLKEQAPALLFGTGNRALLAGGGLAMPGSKTATTEESAFTRNVATLCAGAGFPVITDGTPGIAHLATAACLEAGGAAVSILAGQLLQHSLERSVRRGLANERLLLLSPCHPVAPLTTAAAMVRNKLLYALADYGLVVSAEYKKGDTWLGAAEALQRLHSVPLFVRLPPTTPQPSSSPPIRNGNTALHSQGARSWPHVTESHLLRETLRTSAATTQATEQLLLG